MDRTIKKGYVESAMELINEQVWDAYLSIDVKQKSGDEIIPEKLRYYLKNTTQFLGLKDFFKENKAKEVWITDEVISIKEEQELYALLHAIIGMDVLVHLRVDSGYVERTESLLYSVAIEETDVRIAFVKWIYSNDGYLIQLRKRFSYISESIVRLYEDGNGTIIHEDEFGFKISYFKLKNTACQKITTSISQKIDKIINNPKLMSEDDRFWGFAVHLKYNVSWKYPDAAGRLCDGYVYDDIEYSNDENNIKIAKQLLSEPEAKEFWIKSSDISLSNEWDSSDVIIALPKGKLHHRKRI